MTFWEIARKDLILLRRDARALFVLVAFPLLFITIVGMTTGQLLGWKSENNVLKIGLVDGVDYAAITDDGERQQARNMVAKIANRLQEEYRCRVIVLESRADVQQMLDDEEVNAVLVVGPEFYQRVLALQVGDILSRKEGRLKEGLVSFDCSLESNLRETSTTLSIIDKSIFGAAVETVTPYILCDHTKINLGNIQKNAGLRAKLGCLQLHNEKVVIRTKTETNTEEEAEETGETSGGGKQVYQGIIPSYTVMFVFFLVNIMGRSFLHERELGTLRRLRLAPISSAALVAGKTVPFLVISLLQSVLLFLSGRLIFGMSWGAVPLMLLPVIFCTSLAATGLGLVVATLVRSESQVSAYGNVVVITMAGISGCFMPRAWLPPQLQQISLGTPHAWALISYEQLLKQQTPDLAIVWQNCGVLVLFATLFFLFGCWRFRSLQ